MIKIFGDIESVKWLYAKGALFVGLAVIAATLLILRAPRADVCLLLLICVWASCRAYYFAFYVIQHYADKNYRYAGLLDFAKYVLRRRGNQERAGQGGQNNSHE